jgi:hypothetical protein
MSGRAAGALYEPSVKRLLTTRHAPRFRLHRRRGSGDCT